MTRDVRSALVVFGILVVHAGLGCAPLRSGSEIGPPELDATEVVDQAPVVVTWGKLVYPEFARDAGITGDVLIRVRIAEDGSPHEVIVLNGKTGLDAAAVDAVRRSTFRPALRSGQPVSAWLRIPVIFRY